MADEPPRPRGELARPDRIRLEVSSVCQLRCPSCPTPTGRAAAAVGRGMLSLADFRRLVEANPWIRSIEISNYGEPFLNPALPEILAAGHALGVALTCSNGANLDRATRTALEAVVRHELRSLTCSIDGTSQAVYERYRVGGRLDRVLANVATISRLKREHATRYPELTWQFVVFDHNAHEIEAARELAAELDMEFRPKLTWDRNRPPAEVARRLFGVASREEHLERTGHDLMEGLCLQLWDEPQINWNGRVLGCCRNFWGDFGDGAFDDLEQAINGEKMRYARRMLLGRAASRDDVPCSTCSIYQARRARGEAIR